MNDDESYGMDRETEGNFASTTVEAPRVVCLLQKMELAALRNDHSKLAKTAGQWWVSEGEQVVGPWAFEAILRQLLDGVGSVTIMPVREDEEEEGWRTLTYSPLWNRPGFVRAWTFGFWVTVVVLGWCVIATATPHRWEAWAAWLYGGALGGWALSCYVGSTARGGPNREKGSWIPGMTRAARRMVLVLLLAAGGGFLLQRIDWKQWSPAGKATVSEQAEEDVSAPLVDSVIESEENERDGPGMEAKAREAGPKSAISRAEPENPVEVSPDWAGRILPKQVRLVKPVRFSVMKQTGTWGQVEAPEGLVVAVLGAEGGRLRLGFRDGTALVQPAATDLATRMGEVDSAAEGKGTVGPPKAGALAGTRIEFPDDRQASTATLRDAGATGDKPVNVSVPGNPGPTGQKLEFTAVEMGVTLMAAEVPPEEKSPVFPPANDREPMISPSAAKARGSLEAKNDPASNGSDSPAADAGVAAALGRAGANRGELEKALAAVPGPDMNLLISKARQYDLVNLTAEHLLHTVSLTRQARREAPWTKTVTDAVWTEFVLPYRIADEDLDDWRTEFREKLQPEIAVCRDSKAAMLAIHRWLWKGDEGQAFVKFAVSESRDQSPRQLLNETKIGRCFEINLLFTALLRSAGIPARLAGTSWWSGKDFYHYWVEYWDSEKRDWDYIEGAASDPKVFMGKKIPMPTVYALPGFCEVADPISRERWDTLIDVSERYRKPGSIAVTARAEDRTAPVTYTAYVWNMSAWRSVAAKVSTEGAVFELGPNYQGLPYLITASAGGKIGMELTDVKEATRVDKELVMDATGGPGRVAEWKAPEKVATR